PRILILDNPLIGLDHSTRGLFLELLNGLSKQPHLQIILVIPTGETLPQFITHVLPVNQKRVQKKLTLKEYKEEFSFETTLIQKGRGEVKKEGDFLFNPVPSFLKTNSEIVRLNNVNLGYDGVHLLKDLTWIIHRGEKWKLTGENGTGKSALLSLIYADNPQSYAQDIHLFGRRRGTGESIWEIKSRIGYLSPEMHRSYLKNLPVIEIVASGLHDSLGLYKKTTEAEQASCLFWMRLFQIEHLQERSFLQISSGEQRLALLARAFVKNPELLILDEPFHGLDVYHCQRVKQLIADFCNQPDKTLIMVTHHEEDFPKIMTHSLHLEKNNLYLISEL
ncbi:MAG: ATP-binding cassette domain-containing protein, partial [Bacteroidales bacterium]|nr:ATP-binding cassette domain-containing protein [Bacteroidales bacterium]